MPIVEVTAFDTRFTDPNINQRLITAVTDAIVEVFGEQARTETWVLLNGVDRSRWGFGGEVRT